MGVVKFFPFGQMGVNLSSQGAGLATEVGVAIGKEVHQGDFEAIFSINPNISFMTDQKRTGATGTISGMLFWPMMMTAGAGANYNFSKDRIEPTLQFAAQTLIPLGSEGVFGGLGVALPDASRPRETGINIMFMVTGDLSSL